MFVKIDKKTLHEEPISSEEMVSVLEQDFKADLIDEVLTEIVSGAYEHSNVFALFKYKY